MASADLKPGASGWSDRLRLLCLIIPGGVLLYFLILPLDWADQLFLSIALILAAVFTNRLSKSYLATLAIASISIFSSARYMYYRATNTFGLGAESGAQPRTVDMVFMLILLAAELYAFLILVLGYFQTVRPLGRNPIPLPDDHTHWPTVDIYVPTYNEPLSVARYTVLAALNLDWPADLYKVYILDDGRREEFRKFAAEVGCGYIERRSNEHAKAGNINNALTKTKGEFIVVFDCDHVPTRSFLQMVMGWFRKDERLGMLQTPHHFYSPDPFERNLNQFRKIPNEGELFYGLVQDGNDFWNATTFCGSCAMLRRSAIEEIGGIAVETVTEDAHTSLRMQIRGWNTAYINIPQAAGLATESLSSHIGQRIRWARGMIQILRINNPLTSPGLRLPQRLCYFNAMIHFLYAVPRLIFLTSPLVYLILGHLNIRGYSVTIMAYALPHVALSNLTNSRIQGKYRYSFWNEVYESVLAPYILFPTLMALVNPRLGKFNVTPKGGLVPESYFDRSVALPYIALLFLNLAGLLFGISKMLWWKGAHPGTVLMNMIWTSYNLVILGVSCAVAFERKQVRLQVRVPLQVPVIVHFGDGLTLQGETADISNSGLAIRIPRGMNLNASDFVSVSFALRAVCAELPAKVVGNEKGRLRLRFDYLNQIQEEELTRVLYSRADSWLSYADQRDRDQPLRSLLLLVQLSVQGIALAFRNFWKRTKPSAEVRTENELASPKPASASGIALLVLFGLGLSGTSARATIHESAKAAAFESPANVQESPGANSFRTARDFASLGYKQPILMVGTQSTDTVTFALPSSQVVTSAVLQLRYRLATQLEEKVSQLKVSVNGVNVALVSLVHSPDERSDGELDLTIPAELLVTDNSIELELVGICSSTCLEANLTTIIEPTSQLDLAGQRLMLVNNLGLLPAPFLDSSMHNAAIMFAFPSEPDVETLRAAGIVAAWFGLRADFRGVRFPVSLNRIPQDNAIVVGLAGALPSVLGLTQVSKPTIALRPNPEDAYGKVLVITGADAEQLLRAAEALAMGPSVVGTGDTTEAAPLPKPSPHQADDAPRWLPSGETATLGDYFRAEQLRMSGFGSETLHFRLPPDLYFGNTGSIPLRLNFRVDGLASDQNTTLKISLNSIPVAQISVSGDATLIQHATVALPISALQPYSEELTMDWASVAGTPSVVEPDLQLMRNSTLDIKGVSHFIDMPKLERLAEAGYPFTRYADLSQTAVVFANIHSASQISAYLDLMGYFADQTGYPGLDVTVIPQSEMNSLASKDFILLASFPEAAVLERFGKESPLRASGGALRLNDDDRWWMDIRRSSWNLKGRNRQSIEDLLEADPGPQGMIVGLESPFQRSRTATLILGRDDNAIELLATQLAGIERTGAIYGSLSVLYDNRFESLYLTRNLYQIGTLPGYQQVDFWFHRRVYLLPIFVIGCCVLPTVWLLPWIERRVTWRLKGGA